VFGCGGDRDRTKRPLMGAVAARLSDLVIVTSDNPRSEDPEKIIEEIRRGIVMPADRIAPKGQKARPRSRSSTGASDRAGRARAKRGDLILIAGKGHEKYQVSAPDAGVDDVEVGARRADRRRSALASDVVSTRTGH